MAARQSPRRRSFRRLERVLSMGLGVDVLAFAAALIASGMGIGWLKVLGVVVTVLLSAAGCGYLVLIQEHRRRRSWWLLAAFGSLFLCMLVSLLVGYPAPAVTP